MQEFARFVMTRCGVVETNKSQSTSPPVKEPVVRRDLVRLEMYCVVIADCIWRSDGDLQGNNGPAHDQRSQRSAETIHILPSRRG